MTLTEPANGSTATTSSEATVNEITSDDLAYWGGVVFIPTAFTAGDKAEIRFYIWNSNASQLECVYYVPLVGETAALKETAIVFPPLQTKRYKLTFFRTLGTDRTFKWQITRQNG